MRVQIHTDYITLGQLLKKIDLISSGGEARDFLADTKVLVNGNVENRRGRKLYNQDEVVIPGVGKIWIEGGKSDDC